jgi:hypothetical protein
MKELIFGILALLLGFPIGLYLKKLTMDENKEGQKWFKFIIIASLLGAIVSLFFRLDFLLFSFLFIAIVASGSLQRK